MLTTAELARLNADALAHGRHAAPPGLFSDIEPGGMHLVYQEFLRTADDPRSTWVWLVMVSMVDESAASVALEVEEADIGTGKWVAMAALPEIARRDHHPMVRRGGGGEP